MQARQRQHPLFPEWKKLYPTPALKWCARAGLRDRANGGGLSEGQVKRG